MSNHPKVIIFDLDETLGYFTQFNILWNLLINYANLNNLNIDNIFNQELFNNLLDLYPEFMRKSIYPILLYIKYKKMIGKCNNVFIYTNNQCLGNWVELIKNYLEDKINYKLFDDVIKIYKIKDTIINELRTTNDKTFDDFIRCTNININSKLCMIDDNNFQIRKHNNVTYIKIIPYIYTLPFITLFSRFVNSNNYHIFTNNRSDFINYVISKLDNKTIKYKKKIELDKRIDNINSRRIMLKLQQFFSS